MTATTIEATAPVKGVPVAILGDYEAQDLPEARQRFAALLGLDEPVSDEVLTAAVNDPLYAMHLLSSRSSPPLLNILLSNPPRQKDDPLKSAFPAQEEHSTAELLGRFAKAMVNWSKSGFATAPKEVYEARLDACRACPNLRDKKTGSILQRLAATVGMEGKSCGLCGCMVAAKARIMREKCPGEDPLRAGFNRWGDAMA